LLIKLSKESYNTPDKLKKLTEKILLNPKKLEKFLKEKKDLSLYHQTLVGKGILDKVNDMDNILEKGNVKKMAEVNEGFDKLEKESPKLYAYCKVFYRTLMNYLSAF